MNSFVFSLFRQLFLFLTFTQQKSNPLVIFDLQNEPDTIAATTVASVMQAGINGIRAAGATQLILVEGTSWSGAWTWTTSSGNAAAFAAGKITDPQNNIAIEMHQYLDSDGSGTSATCVSNTIGKERVSAATAWLKANNYKGFLGEYGGGANSVCQTAVRFTSPDPLSANADYRGRSKVCSAIFKPLAVLGLAHSSGLL